MALTIAVIGGSGFIGTRLVERLIGSGHTVKILDIARSRRYPELWHEADVRDRSTLVRSLDGADVVVNLAAEHRDNVRPIRRYYDVNVQGAGNVCRAVETLGIKRLVFTSSVAVYRPSSEEVDESGALGPVHEYGRTKLAAESLYRDWCRRSHDRSLTVLRPTVVFGEGNRGNVYNLLKTIANNRFVTVGTGRNVKSMAYVENVAACIEHCTDMPTGERMLNYVDKPDLTMIALVELVRKAIGKPRKVRIRIPYPIGYAGGLVLEGASILLGKELPVSALRVKKFAATTWFSSKYMPEIGFRPPVGLETGLTRTIEYEFLRPHGNGLEFFTE
jgi:nucleoside-diphosphate-sugar epimerase